MRTAEAWHHSENYAALISGKCMCVSCCYVRAVQLDAWKQGMADAANIAMRSQRSETVVAQDIQAAAAERKAI